MCRALAITALLLTALVAPTAWAEQPANEFLDLSLEALMDVSVTSVAGYEQDWFRTPAAIYVLTPEDLQRTGVLYLPDAFRMVPGMHVQQADARQWGIGVRGMTDLLSSRLLVLIDGRTVYDPIFSGVFWVNQAPILDDLHHIEIVRGPGATLWGSNAVNGVINVTSKSARQTQGLYASTAAGNYDTVTELRYGDQFSDSAFYRVWGRYHNRDAYPTRTDAGLAPDDYDLVKGGFRLDTEDGDGGGIRFELGVTHADRLGESSRVPVPPMGEVIDVRDGRTDDIFALIDLERVTDERRQWSLQGYLEYSERDVLAGTSIDRLSADLDFRQNLPLGEAFDLIWGAGLRHDRIETVAGRTLGLRDPDRNLTTVTAFGQVNWALVRDRLDLTFGTKLEHNELSGFEFQPSVRMNWAIDEQQNAWASVSRAVHTPSVIADDMSLLAAYIGGFPVIIEGNENVDAETLYAFELGYRWREGEKIWIDLAGFYNHYVDFVGGDSGTLQWENLGSGETAGGEIAATWQAADNLSITGSYSYVNVDVPAAAFQDFNSAQPRHSVVLRSSLDLTEELQLNAASYYVSEYLDRDETGDHVRLDLGVTWQVNPRLSVSIWGQNLLDSSTFEQDDEFLKSHDQEVPRAFYIRATVNW